MRKKCMEGSSMYADPLFNNPLILSGEIIPSLPDIWGIVPDKLGAWPQDLPDLKRVENWQKLVNPKFINKDWLKERWEKLYESITPQEWQLHEAARKNQPIQIYRLVQEKGVNVDVATDEDGKTPLMIALISQQANAAIALLKLGARLDVADDQGMTPLLLLGGSPVPFDERTHETLTTLMIETMRSQAWQMGQALMDDLLMQTTTRLESVALLLAKVGYAGSLKAILCAASPTARLSLVQRSDEDGMTPLMYAAWNNHADLVEFLVLTMPAEKREAYVLQRNRWGRSARDIAAHWREKSALAILNYHLGEAG